MNTQLYAGGRPAPAKAGGANVTKVAGIVVVSALLLLLWWFWPRAFVGYTEEVNDVSFQMVFVEGGSFRMGDTFDDGEIKKNSVHVSLDSYYLGETEVTQALWRAVMGSDPPELAFKGCDLCPVEQVSWEDAQEFLRKLNAMTGKQYRLPTEAEWEYAAREGGKKVRFGNGKNIADPKEINFIGVAAFREPYSVVGEYRRKTTPVKTFAPNALGLYDMSGNVWEWCSDWVGDYPSVAQTNPQGPSTGSYRVFRGGSWSSFPFNARVVHRQADRPEIRDVDRGFRVALSL